jgi:spermidine synthase
MTDLARGFHRWRFLAVVLLPGAALMALEIVSSRLLAPAFGNSVYVWGSIIGVFLAAMSVGYVAGGRHADRAPSLPALGWLLAASAACQWLTAVFGREAVERLGAASAGRPAGTLLATALLFGPATALLATVAPFAIRIAGRAPAELGGIAGRLYALSTFGSLAGTLGATFVLVPELALDAILALLVTVTAASALLCFAGARGAAAGVTLAAALAVAPWLSPRFGEPPTGVIAELITPYQTLVVMEEAGIRTLLSDGTRHGGVVMATGEPSLSYARGAAAAWILRPEVRRVLVLGLGSGAIGTHLTRAFPEVEVDYVEIDPAVPELARDLLGFRESPRLRVVVDDARRFVARTPETWDLVYCDTYIGQSVPFHLATREFFAEAKRRVAPGGVLALNLAGTLKHPFVRALVRTVRSTFDQAVVIRPPDSANLLLLATDDAEAARPAAWRAAAAALDAGRRHEPSFERLALSRLELDVELSDVPVLTDDYAPVDSLLNLGDAGARFRTAGGS